MTNAQMVAAILAALQDPTNGQTNVNAVVLALMINYVQVATSDQLTQLMTTLNLPTS